MSPLSRLSCLLVSIALLLLAGPAHAQQPVQPVAGAPPASPGAPPSGAPPAVENPPPAQEKSGRFMANFKIGPAFLIHPTLSAGVTVTLGTIILEGGIALMPNNNGYLIFPLTFQFNSSLAFIQFPLGFQYDVKLPVKGLYLTPRGSLGYTLSVTSTRTGTFYGHGGVFTPEIGIKYIMLNGRLNLGLDAFSLPVLFGDDDGALVFYRLLVYAGANF